VHPDGWPGISAVAAENLRVMPAYGIHPMHAGCVNDQVLDQLLNFGRGLLSVKLIRLIRHHWPAGAGFSQQPG
jgi:hypothetical protein